MDGKAALSGDSGLAFLDFCIIEFFYPATLQAHQVVVVVDATEFEYRLAAFKMVAFQQPCLFKLCQHPIDRSKADIFTFINQCFVNIFRRQMPHRATLEQAKYSQSW